MMIFFLKFTLQKTYLQPQTYEQIDYRYPILVCINIENGFLEIRYDAIRFGEQFENEAYSKIVNACIS